MKIIYYIPKILYNKTKDIFYIFLYIKKIIFLKISSKIAKIFIIIAVVKLISKLVFI